MPAMCKPGGIGKTNSRIGGSPIFHAVIGSLC
jgi:hypothetical protein